MMRSNAIKILYISLVFFFVQAVFVYAEKGDVNNDGVVDAIDLTLLKSNVAADADYNGSEDIDDDGRVDFYDIYRLDNYLNESVPLDPRFSIRDFKIDTNGRTLFVFGAENAPEAELREFQNGKKINEWDVNYRKIGASRSQCYPPLMNITFDKDDRYGNPKELFAGRSTYGSSMTLFYQRLKLLSECDLWEDYGNRYNNNGFFGEADVLLREYFISELFRKFGIPTAEVVAFANVRFDTGDSDISKNKRHRYLFYQRTEEQDDEVFFTDQFGLSPILATGENNGYDYQGDRFYFLTFKDPNDGSVKNVQLDPENTIKYFLLGDLINLTDRGVYHNESYGGHIASGNWKTVPFDFDLSFTCNVPQRPNVSSHIENLPAERREEYKSLYFGIANEIFGNADSLNEMLLILDKFPFDVDKNKIKNYLRLSFYNFYDHFNPTGFSADTGEKLESAAGQIMSRQEYEGLYSSFIQDCVRKYSPLPNVSVEILDSSFQLSNNDGMSENELTARYKVSLTTGNQYVYLSKYNPFQIQLQSTTTISFRDFGYFTTENVSSLSETRGPYYLILPNSTVIFDGFAKKFADNLEAGYYGASLTHINLGNDYELLPAPPNETERIYFAGNKAPRILSVDSINSLNTSQFRVIGMRFSRDKNIIRFEPSEGGEVKTIILPANPQGTQIVFVPENYDIKPGRYFLTISTEESGTGNSLGINISADYSSMVKISGAKLTLAYDELKREESLVALFDLYIIADEDVEIGKDFAFMVTAESQNNRAMSKYGEIISVLGAEVKETTYVIKKGDTAKFVVTARFKPRTMIGGLYNARITSINLPRYAFIAPRPYRTNNVLIVGESVPTIVDFPADPVAQDGEIIIGGENFLKVNNIINVGGRILVLPSLEDWVKKMRIIKFSPRAYGIMPGVYDVVVMTSPKAISDTVKINITDPNVPETVSIIKVDWPYYSVTVGKKFEPVIYVKNHTVGKLVVDVRLTDQKNWGGNARVEISPAQTVPVKIILEPKEWHASYNPHNFVIEAGLNASTTRTLRVNPISASPSPSVSPSVAPIKKTAPTTEINTSSQDTFQATPAISPEVSPTPSTSVSPSVSPTSTASPAPTVSTSPSPSASPSALLYQKLNLASLLSVVLELLGL
ncbi:MAG: hypothetical protein A3G52_04070 [Candidatus Taylorbacteria bacterium RIFCSPLOWO2_12_FULL_43_20]|uniref:Dockerin domain-containing protein n=1 Tax=Candidatus Taylorbacteria bacterium RIFCSPLOWO2_12_FULL_43_20 TaxID=1802332 RepID=A0A1G2P0M3_9BACT|nr:MAG: hypothetical protein A2825_00270 [Candidatus Taylorbacteria bacterium RIFCSPHIGHO2_01_FULL_43_120]OHA22565.1 MAG: hypothetical protein A3B98_02630 [Candidatus Taylorbacteria bacterium RIFCSPHIGHO2_02_FULL_43_55]OHA28599.1 MAG: hypothetical protein A3E92_01505 [Candidatus Taylorbacteria bacterium RIFCSPHIGHO2_12_FULL_42_34]OHA30513.1 MAG: hypothetical protein A3B09_00145 [Candidatus Taylorbacteria bacterium RIFCSPLOWO2_01_FULL_43_83]OHA38099.1 MAG: hypothetical protein A3H58_00960 [Candi